MPTSYRPIPAMLAACALLFSVSCARSPQSVAGPAGFVEAWFDASSLNSLMSDPNCAFVRFYNARRLASDTRGTCIAIATKADGSPLYNGTTLKYRMHDLITGGATPMTLLTDVQAKAKIRFVTDAGENKYAVNFTKASIQTLLSAAGCNGIRLIPELLTSGLYSMRMHPAKLSGTGGTVNPAPPSVLCTEPCPNYCGSYPAYYINLP